jgi:hypothetical protein
MAIDFDLQKKLIWDNEKNKLTSKYEVSLKVFGNKGGIFYESNPPIYIEKLSEYFEAKEVLLQKFHKNLNIAT